MDLGLRDKIVLVTGGAKGIGAATVEAFSVEDCRVVLVDRDAETGSSLEKSLGSRVSYIEADLTNLEACKKAIEQTVSLFGGLDILVNNAGFNDGLGLETPPEDFMISVKIIFCMSMQ
jgi:L-fucose dehydrogenase